MAEDGFAGTGSGAPAKLGNEIGCGDAGRLTAGNAKPAEATGIGADAAAAGALASTTGGGTTGGGATAGCFGAMTAVAIGTVAGWASVALGLAASCGVTCSMTMLAATPTATA